MAKSGESRMNLAALQRVDSDIRGIVDNASQVALYKFSPKANEWEKTEIEGTLFIYVRSQPPHHGFIIMNRLNTTNLMEPITEELDFQSQTPFLLYRNAKGSIYGIWFYEKEECTRVGQLMNNVRANQQLPSGIKVDSKLFCDSSQQNNLMQQRSINQRQRCASESDSRKVKEKKTGKSIMKDIDIISLLSRAQDEYDKKANHSENRNEPKKVVQSITMSGKHDNDVIKPTPVRASGKTATPLSVDSLFAQASGCNQEVYLLDSGSSFPGDQEPQLRARSLSSGSFDIKNKDNAGTILHRLLSNPANTVEHIEKLQRNEATIKDRTKKTSETHTSNLLTANVGQTINEMNKQHSSSSVESLEQDLKKKLKLISPSDGVRKDCTSPSVIAAVSTKSPATIIEESSQFLLMENQSNNIEQITASLSSKEANIHPILTPAAFENCNPLNNFNDRMDVSLGGLDTLTSNDSFRAAAKSLKLIPQNQSSEPMTLISPMVFAMTNNNVNGTIKPSSPHIDKMPLDILSTNNNQLGTSHGISVPPSSSSSSSSSGLLLPQHLVNGIVPSGIKFKEKNILKPGITPLTKDQLKEALLYMLQNDVDFLSKIHESYVNSLRTRLNSTKS